MKIKITFIFVFLFVFLGFKVACASVIINEIMYDLPGSVTLSGKNREWIEIHNTDNSAIDITGEWRFNDGSSHYLNDKNTFSIPADGFIVLAGDKATFLTDHPGFSGTVIDTSMSLSNTGSTLKILDASGNATDTVTYSSSQGANGDGNSLQLVNGAWVAATPTPGVANENTIITEPPVGGGNSSGGGGTFSATTPETKTKVVETPQIKTKITAKNLAYVGIPFELEANTLGYSNEIRNYGKYFWNFGDGDSKEINLNQNGKFTHTYYYEGEYNITLEYYSNYYSLVPDTTSNFIIKVIPATVFISKVGDEKDFFIELSNNSDYDINVSKWMLGSSNKTFTLPKNTNIPTKGKIILSPKITGFTVEDKDSLKLLKSTGEIAFDFNPPNVNKIIPKTFIKSAQKNENTPQVKEIPPSVDSNLNLQNEAEISASDLSASSVLSGTNDKNQNKSYFFFWGFVVLLFISGGGVYYIRQRKNVSNVGDDFKIIDE